MSDADKRVYSSDLRDAQARATRRQVVAAAGALFAEHGFGATTIEDVAKAAGVSRKTVFTSVGGKVDLLKLAFDWAVAGDDEPVPVMDREAIQAAMVEPDARRVVEMYADMMVESMPRVAGIYVALLGAAAVDPAARALFEEVQGQRLHGMRAMAGQLHRLGALRPGLSTGAAADILWVHNDPLLYHRLVHDRGWSTRRWRDWLARSVKVQLLGGGEP